MAQLYIYWRRFLLEDKVANCNKTGDIVCLSGPFPPITCADLKTFSENVLGPRENVVVDCKYRGDAFICVPDDTHKRSHSI